MSEPTSRPCCIWLEDAGALLVQREDFPASLSGPPPSPPPT